MKRTALLIGAGPSPGAESVVRREGARTDIVIAVDGGAALCRAAGVRPDVVVGDLDSLEHSIAEHLRADGVRFVVYPADKDSSDLDLAIAEARQLGVGSITVTAVTAGRIDHTLAAIGSLAGCADLMPVLAEPDVMGWVLDSRYRAQLTLASQGSVFSVLAVETECEVSIEGARWPLDHHRLSRLSSHAVGNTVSSGGARISVHSGTVLVTCTD